MYRTRSMLVVTALSAVALVVPSASAVAQQGPDIAAGRPLPAGTATDRLLVTVSADRAADVSRAVSALGGQVTRRLPLVSALAVSLPHGSVGRLATLPGVSSVVPDAKARVLGGVASDGGPSSVFRKVVGSEDAAKAGADGSGVGVAVIDTGIANVPDLAARVRPVIDDTGQARPCLNLSGEPDCGDSYGHGTFVAGLIAGDGTSSAGAVRGVAPGAHLTSVKVAGRDGSTDVSTILAAIQWVVTYKDRYGIQVLNLSLGTDSTQSYRVDPLDYAVERAWASGLTVVVAAGNLGPAAGTVTKPADDPFVISVGAVDDRGTPRSERRSVARLLRPRSDARGRSEQARPRRPRRAPAVHPGAG